MLILSKLATRVDRSIAEKADPADLDLDAIAKRRRCARARELWRFVWLTNGSRCVGLVFWGISALPVCPGYASLGLTAPHSEMFFRRRRICLETPISFDAVLDRFRAASDASAIGLDYFPFVGGVEHYTFRFAHKNRTALGLLAALRLLFGAPVLFPGIYGHVAPDAGATQVTLDAPISQVLEPRTFFLAAALGGAAWYELGALLGAGTVLAYIIATLLLGSLTTYHYLRGFAATARELLSGSEAPNLHLARAYNPVRARKWI